MPQIRVNLKSRVINAAIRHETRNGRAVIVVPSATLPDGVVMNDIHYPADEIAKSYGTLEGTLAPFGHPMVGNRYVSALHPEAINGFHVGAFNANVRRENGRVHVDKVIDVEVASQSAKGKQLLEAINKGEPIHTSTGIFLNMEDAEQGKPYKYVARNFHVDHDAILLNEPGAATPEQGVGMMVNADGSKTDIPVINSVIEGDEEKESFFDMLFSLFKANKLQTVKEDSPMPDVTREEFNALAKSVTDLGAALKTNAEALPGALQAAVTAALAPITAKVETLATNAAAAEDAARAPIVADLVKAGLMTEDEAKPMAINVLRNLHAKLAPKPAASLFGGFAPNASGDDPWKDYSLNPKDEKQ